MFNPANLAEEIFGVLRSFDYTVNIFDFDGNRVYEPEEARRFFATPKNITVSIFEDGENSSIKMFLSQATEVTEVAGLIETMRVTASKFGVLFNVRKYERELKPKDLSPSAQIERDPGIAIANKHNVEADKLDTIKDELGDLVGEFKEIADHFKNKKNEKVKESMDTLEEKKGPPMMALPALGCEVEIEEWNAFKDNQHLDLYNAPDQIPTDRNAPEFVKACQLRAIAEKVKADGMANMFSIVADAIEHGSKSKLLHLIADRAIGIAYHADPEPEAAPAPKRQKTDEGLIVTESIREFGAWFDSLSCKALFESDDDYRDTPEAERMQRLLNDRDPFSDSFESALDIAYMAVKDEFSVDAFLEAMGSDFGYGDETFTKADKEVSCHTLKSSLTHYLQQQLEDALDGEEYPSEHEVKGLADEFIDTIKDRLTSEEWTLTDCDTKEDDEEDSEHKLNEWADEGAMDGAFRRLMHAKVRDPNIAEWSDEIAQVWNTAENLPKIAKWVEIIKAGRPDIYAHREFQQVVRLAQHGLSEDKVEEDKLVPADDAELAPEDVLLPKNPSNDLANEVTSDESDEEMNRIISLARGKTL